MSLERQRFAVLPALTIEAMSASSGGQGGVTACYALLSGLGLLLWWACSFHPTLLPSWAPWDFSPSWYAATVFSVYWYWRGLLRTPPTLRPARWRHAVYFSGIGMLYFVLQTRFDYLAQHMFFLNRVQHIVMHHLGPALIAIAWPGAVLKRGMPSALRRLVELPRLAAVLHWIQQPVLAAALFVGLIALWLYPPVHFQAMIDGRLYALMNWSMVVDGVLFWCLLLDPKPSPPARIPVFWRATVAALVMYPQIAMGMMITFSQHDLYSFYALCGRAFASFTPSLDQTLGGLIVWIPGAMMSVLAFVYILYLHGNGHTARQRLVDGAL